MSGQRRGAALKVEAGRAAPAEFGEIKSGSLAVRLAAADGDLDAAQALRYRVFYEEMAAHASPGMAHERRDRDAFDDYCDHLLVVDDSGGRAAVVGTYRLMRRAHARSAGSFYSAGEYDIACIEKYPGEILELGRSCVDAAHRQGPAMQLLWRGIAQYIFLHDIELMFGCASLPGTKPAALALPLSYLYHYHLAPPAVRPRALAKYYTAMNMLRACDIDTKAAAALPPLVKGYLRLGGFVGDGAVVDRQFNTTDVCIVVKTDQVTDKYYRHYTRALRDAGERSGHGRS